ncbi:MAG: ABC transporter permease subunit [Myxococcaceae bacterium]
MRTVLSVAFDLLREARSRKWFLALALAITAVLVTLGLSLRMEVLDGALAASRLFGKVIHNDIRPVDVSLRPVFTAAAYLVFYGGTAFMVLACADFAPSLLSPGRIEHLLALPVRRWQLLAGTYLGVLTLALAGSVYGSGGLAVILGVKTGVWTLRPVVAALLSVASFATLYAAMLATAMFARSAALSAAVGVLVMVLGIIAGYRAEIAKVFEPGAGRAAFSAATLLMPRVSSLADASAKLAGSEPVDLGAMSRLLAGFFLFSLGALALGVWRFERRDF